MPTRAQLYVNGVKEDEESVPNSSLHRAGGLDRFCIGGESGGGFGSFCGAVCDVAVWQHALTHEWVNSAWFNKSQPDVHDTHLVGYWRMNEGHVPARLDASPNIARGDDDAPPVWDAARTNTQHVFDYSIYGNQGVVVGRPRSAATTLPLYFDARKH